MPDTPTGHELLIRIDERQEAMSKQLNTICGKVDKKVDDDKDYQEIVNKVNSLWDSKNKMIGWMVGAGATGGTIASIIKSLVSDVLAK